VNRVLSTAKKNSKIDCQHFSQALWTYMRMKTLAAVRFLSFSTQGPSNGSTQGSSKHYQDVAYILCASYKLGLKSELDQVIARFSKDGSLASASILETVYLPFLVGLAKWIEKSKALNFPSFQKLYQNILSSFISQSVTLTQSTTRLDSKDSWVWLHEL
jgi:hypothetical protein